MLYMRLKLNLLSETDLLYKKLAYEMKMPQPSFTGKKNFFFFAMDDI